MASSEEWRSVFDSVNLNHIKYIQYQLPYELGTSLSLIQQELKNNRGIRYGNNYIYKLRITGGNLGNSGRNNKWN